MTATLTLPETPAKIPETSAKIQPKNVISLEEFLVKPPERMEWVDGNLVEKTGMTFKHGLAQSKLSTYWRIYKDSRGQGGEVLTETLCRTAKQGRRPDVAYITLELLPPSGWLLFPEARLVFVNANQGWHLFNANEIVNTQTILAGFSIAVNELLA